MGKAPDDQERLPHSLAMVRRRFAFGAVVLCYLQLHCSCVSFDSLLVVAQIHLWQAAGSVQSVDKNMRVAARRVLKLLVGSVSAAQWRRGHHCGVA